MHTELLPYLIPSPPQGEWTLFGFLPIRAYALCIMAGIIAGVLLGRARWKARGGNPETVEAVAIAAVPLGIIGARIYHVVSDYQLYFGPGKNPWDAFAIWNGGLGIWGAIPLGGLGVWLVCRRRGVRFWALADALAPGIILAQGVGRLGNWFNQELFGRPTELPWALAIDPAHRPPGYEQFASFHPTFLYELLWNVGVCLVLLWADRRFRLGRGKVFALYVVLYTAGRFWIEALRIDQVNHIGEFRLNNYTSFLVFAGALIWLIWLWRNRPGREDVVDESAVEERADTEDPEGGADPGAGADSEDAGESEGTAEHRRPS